MTAGIRSSALERLPWLEETVAFGTVGWARSRLQDPPSEAQENESEPLRKRETTGNASSDQHIKEMKSGKRKLEKSQTSKVTATVYLFK